MQSTRAFPAVVLYIIAAAGLSTPPAHAADGAGAGTSGALMLIQTEYLSPLDGNVVMVFFGQLAPVRGVTVLVDDVFVGDFDVIEGSVSVPFLDSGEHTFRVETTSPEEHSFAEGTFFVRDAQPFQDPKDLVCEGNGPGADGTCKAILRWTLPADPPELFWVLQDTIVTDRDLPATETSAVFETVTAGQHVFGLRGIETAQPGLAFYAGPIVETACNVACDGAACRPPSEIGLCQSGYGPGGAVRVEVVPGGDYPGGIDILVGGSIVKNTAVSPGGRTVAFVPSPQGGPLTLSFRGACADGRDTASVDAAITLLDESPLPGPLEDGTLACEFQAGSGLVATWRNAFPASFIDVHLVSAETTRHVATLPGGTESVLIAQAAPGDGIAIQAFADVGGVCRGSPLASCALSSESRFLRGLCSGAGSFPSISDGVFTLNYLFFGGTQPPCIEACDTSGDSNLDISDAVYLLNFLFLGGPAPVGWDTSGGVPAPACESGSGDSCVTAHTAACF